jgi:dipeptidyl aminopeptidase/acylaminoacyl peptidase
MSRKPVSPADLGQLASLSDVRLSADGRFAAVVVSANNLADNHRDSVIAVAPVDGSGPARRLSASAPAQTLPRWVPGEPGKPALAAVSRDGAYWQIQRHTMDGEPPSVLVASWPDPIEELAWSPDGSSLLFVCRVPQDRQELSLPDDRRPPLRLTRLRYREDGIGWTFNRPRQAYILQVASGSVRKLSVGGYDDAEFAWHPDGESVVFVSQRQPDADRTLLNDVYRQYLDSASEATRITATQHCYSQPSVSPDGTRVALTATDVLGFPATAGLGVVPLAGGAVTMLSATLDRDCNSTWPGTNAPIWRGDDSVLVLVDDAGAIRACEFMTTSPGRHQTILAGDRQITSLDACGDTLVFATSSPAEPPQLVTRVPGESERTVHAPNLGYRETRDLRLPQHRSTAVAERTAVDSWLTLPDPDLWLPRYPLLVCMQGGGTQYGYQWSHEFQALCAAGFATLYLNPRGSAGYGTGWMRTVAGPRAAVPGRGWGADDIGDVVAVLDDVLHSTPELDPRRVGVLGGSYGGLVVTWLLGSTDKFRAGWAERGPYNLFSLAGTNDESPWFFTSYLGTTQVDDPAAYWAPSPLRLAAGITAPLMIVHSEEDRRCPIQQAEELFMALKLLGREVEFIRFPGEGHGLTRTGSPVHQLQRLELMLEWFSRWLAPCSPVPADGTSP